MPESEQQGSWSEEDKVDLKIPEFEQQESCSKEDEVVVAMLCSSSFFLQDSEKGCLELGVAQERVG
jgi:hypothetical protein